MNKKWLLAPAVVLLSMQLFPIRKTAEKSREENEFHVLAHPPDKVMGLLKPACYDCHSNAPRYPWYARVQPVGWWIQDHVEEGRSAFNFSTFGTMSTDDQGDVLRDCAIKIKKGEMPLSSYAAMHPDARWSLEQKQIVVRWLLQRADSLKQDVSGPETRVHAGDCDNTDEIPRCAFEGMPDKLGPVVTVAGHAEAGERLILQGRLLQADGQTPLSNAYLYVYHTNAQGIYPKKGDETGVRRFHGYLHGWLKTDQLGRYEIRTIRPAPYPGRKNAAHIHAVLWAPEQKIEPRWVDEFLFADDPLVGPAERKKAERRPGHSALVTLRKGEDGIWRGARIITAD